MNTVRYLTFEISQTCNLAKQHEGKCPINHPERYRFSPRTMSITDSLIMNFWRWARKHGFRGFVMFNLYNEPTLSISRIRDLMIKMKTEDPFQPFSIFTNNPKFDATGFDIVKVTDYDFGKDLDDRILSAQGEGRPYSEVQARGWCGRGYGWEVPIDNFGNWLLCCNDWRCEEAMGNLYIDDWSQMLTKYRVKAKQIRWHDEESYQMLPRMCRSCLDVNPNLHRSGATF